MATLKTQKKLVISTDETRISLKQCADNCREVIMNNVSALDNTPGTLNKLKALINDACSWLGNFQVFGTKISKEANEQGVLQVGKTQLSYDTTFKNAFKEVKRTLEPVDNATDREIEVEERVPSVR